MLEQGEKERKREREREKERERERERERKKEKKKEREEERELTISHCFLPVSAAVPYKIQRTYKRALEISGIGL